MIYLMLAPVFLGVALFFFKLTTNTTHPFIGNLLAFLPAFLIQFSVFTYAKIRGFDLFFSQKGIIFALSGGIFIGIYSVFVFLALSKFEVFRTMPIVYIGAILLTTILGALFLKEHISWVNILGMLAIFIGFFLIFQK